MEDKLSKDGKRAKCATCGQWYGIDEYHGNASPRHIGTELAAALERQLKATGRTPIEEYRLDKTDIAAARSFVESVQRGAFALESRNQER